MVWEIVRVPDKVASSKDCAVDVVAALVEPKQASAIMRELSQIAPLEELRHVKRIRRKQTEAGTNELSIILYPSLDGAYEFKTTRDDVQKLINNYHLNPFTAKVAKYPATSKEEWEEQCKLWPTSYHPTANNYVIGFNEEDSQWIITCMKTTLKLANVCRFDDQVVNAALIVDPVCRQIISSAVDQTTISTADASLHLDATSKVNCGDDVDYTAEKSTAESASVSCLHPWSWAFLSPRDISRHPLKHAAMVAIESSAARDRQFFCRLSDNSSKRQRRENPQEELAGSYLCTGFDVFLAWEPCAMCAMALVHQRVRRVFFALPNPNAGALGGVHMLQAERSLNHHYSVFRVSAS